MNVTCISRHSQRDLAPHTAPWQSNAGNSDTPQVRGLVFDAGDVLYDESSWRHWLFQLLHRHGVHAAFAPFFHTFDSDYLIEAHHGRVDYWTALRRMLSSVGMSVGQIQEVFAAAQSRKRQFDAELRPLPRVAATLNRLAGSGVKMTAICNSCESSGGLQQQLQQIGVAGYFASIHSSRDLAAAMPSPSIYHTAAQDLGLPQNEIAFVGHDLVQLEGARAAGMIAIAIHHETTAKADLYLERIESLAALFPQVETRAA